MKVKELIEHLQKLDQEKGIWVCYDLCYYLPPVPNRTADADDVEEGEGEVKEGDYLIPAY